MADWQFSIMLAPSKWCSKNRDRISEYLTENGWDLSEAWIHVANDNHVETAIDQFFRRAADQDRDFIQWGDTTSDDVSLIREEGKVVCLSMRIDMRKDCLQLIQTAVAIAIKLDCSIMLMEHQRVIEPSVEALCSAADLSQAKQRAAAIG